MSVERCWTWITEILREKTSPSATVSTINPTWTGLGLNLSLFSELMFF